MLELSVDEIYQVSGGDPPASPQVPLPPVTTTPYGPQIPVGGGTTVGGGTINVPYNPPAPAVRVVIHF